MNCISRLAVKYPTASIGIIALKYWVKMLYRLVIKNIGYQNTLEWIEIWVVNENIINPCSSYLRFLSGDLS